MQSQWHHTLPSNSVKKVNQHELPLELPTVKRRILGWKERDAMPPPEFSKPSHHLDYNVRPLVRMDVPSKTHPESDYAKRHVNDDHGVHLTTGTVHMYMSYTK